MKMVTFVRSFKREKEINTDTLEGFDAVMESKEPTDLDLLLEQIEEGRIFRTNRDAFMKVYKEGVYGVVTVKERMFLNASDRAYERSKELCKKRKSCTNS